jgi:hypothetical protein
MKAAIRATVVVAAFLANAPAGAEEAEGKCTRESFQAGSFLVGVPADRPNSLLGDRVATDTLHEWIPRDPYKQVVCGTLDHVGFFHNVTAEFDWDLYVSPSPEYQLFAADDAAEPCVTRSEQMGSQRPEGTEPPKCMSAEVTAPHRLRNANPWWNWSRQTSTLIGRRFCVYGPWVSDNAHGSRPEIHPVNALWWSNQDQQKADAAAEPLVRNLLILQDASGRFQRGEAFAAPSTMTKGAEGATKGATKKAQGARLSWITTHEDFCIGFDKSAAGARRYRVQTTGDSAKSFEIDVGADGAAVAPKTCPTTRGRPRNESSLDLCSEGGILHLSVRWDPPRCDYCSEEKFVAVRIFPVEESPSKPAPPPAPILPVSVPGEGAARRNLACERVVSTPTDPVETDPDSLPLPLSLQPPPRADSTWLEERPTPLAGPVASEAWTEFSGCLGQVESPPDSTRWAGQLVGIGSSDLIVAREYEGSVQDWSVVWDTSTLRQMALKPGVKDRFLHEHMQTETVRVYLHERTAFEAHRVNARVVMPNWGSRHNDVARNVANVGLAATADEVVDLLDGLVPLGPECGGAAWSSYLGPTDFRQRYVRGLIENEERKSVDAQPAAATTSRSGRRLFTLASLQRIVQAAYDEKPLICYAPRP